MRTEIKIHIDNTCKRCRKGLRYFDKLHKQNKKAYGKFIISPLPISDEEMFKNSIKGILLIPDYNSKGHLTHFHIEKEGEENE